MRETESEGGRKGERKDKEVGKEIRGIKAGGREEDEMKLGDRAKGGVKKRKKERGAWSEIEGEGRGGE